MKPMTPGRFLTADESVRLTVCDTIERQVLIAHIVDRLRAKERPKARRLKGLRDWRAREAR